MSNSKPASTPLVSEINIDTNETESSEKKPYRELLGALMYVSVVSRPDITFAVSYLARFSENYTEEHWTNLKRILKYLIGKSNYCLPLGGITTNTAVTAYCDADFASKSNERKSTTGFIIRVNNGIVAWKSQRQKNITTSTTESEYVAMTMCAHEMLYIKNLLLSIGIEVNQPMEMYGDNQPSIEIAKSNKPQSKIKHVDIKYHFIKQVVEENKIAIEYTRSEDNLADILTKPLGATKQNDLTTKMNVTDYCFRAGVKGNNMKGELCNVVQATINGSNPIHN